MGFAAGLGAGLGSGLATPRVAPASAGHGDGSIGVGIIGCGGRGTGAAFDAMRASDRTRIVALADLLPERLRSCVGHLTNDEDFAGRIDVTAESCHEGFDGFRRLLERPDVQVVIIAGPPGFRPMHIEAAVAAGKHIFAEKPVAVDPVGVRRVIAAADEADRKGLRFVAGTQRRHERSYRAAMARLADGQIGDVISARCYWNQGGLWVHRRRPEYSDMEWQCRNWLYFTWLSGDHIVEQHVHNLDVINWALGATPVRCIGLGGRQSRTAPEYGNIYDHFAVEYEYPDGRSVLSMCRQMDGCPSRVEEVIVGTDGTLTMRPGQAIIEGRHPWRFTGENPSPYVLEHVALFDAIRDGTPINEGRQVAESTLTAIMGRMACYTGQTVSWEFARDRSVLDLSPPHYDYGDLPTPEVAMPGRTPLV